MVTPKSWWITTSSRAHTPVASPGPTRSISGCVQRWLVSMPVEPIASVRNPMISSAPKSSLAPPP
jgi:hypothetical protein